MAIETLTAYQSKIDVILKRYVEDIKRIYGGCLKSVILYGSYARGDFREDSDIDIMILIDMTDIEIKEFRHRLSEVTYDFNENFDVDIKPIAKSSNHFFKWLSVYPFYATVKREGVVLYGTA